MTINESLNPKYRLKRVLKLIQAVLSNLKLIDKMYTAVSILGCPDLSFKY
jgi:hypothetical protein